MGTPLDSAAEAVGSLVAEFVAAADSLVNLLATDPQGSEQSKAVHQRSLDAAYTRYDRARLALTGEDVSSA